MDSLEKEIYKKEAALIHEILCTVGLEHRRGK
jgi:hypothetical protein